MIMTVVINFFGQPGAGKSTHAANLFAHMKRKGINCELVTEYAKRVTWGGTQNILQNQLYVFAKQHNTQFWLKDKVDFIITDSPLLMSLHYGAAEGETFKKIVREKSGEFHNVNFFVKRTKAYNPLGRNQTEDESNTIGEQMQSLLTRESVAYTIIDSDTPVESVMEKIINPSYYHAYILPDSLDKLNDIGLVLR